MASEQERLIVYDAHCHLASSDIIPDAFVADVASNIDQGLAAAGITLPRGRTAAALAAQHRDDQADQLVREMDQAGIARCALLAPDLGLRMPMRLSPRQVAARHHDVRLRHPGRFWIFAGADPRRGTAGVEEFEREVCSYGFEGLKLYPPCGYSPSDKGLFPYYEICAERGLPVFLHTGPTAGSLAYEPAHPLHVDEAARAFPGVNFILGHGGLVHLDVSSYLAAYRRNVYLDIGGFAGTPFASGWEVHLNRLFRLGLNHKIVFGTDWPLNRISGGYKRLVDKILYGPVVFAGVKRREQKMIMGGNLGRLLPSRAQAQAGQTRDTDG